MRYSRHNIFSKMRDSDGHFLLNLLSGNADILSPAEAVAYAEHRIADPAPYEEKGYIMGEKEEQAAFKRAYLEFLERRETDEVQLFFVPHYHCNFACSYCYQADYPETSGATGPEVTDAFFRYIEDRFGGRRKYVTLFGGEPLLPDARSHEMVKRIIEGTRELKLDLAVVTNGYHLEEYTPLLKKGRIREIQVTLDGVGPVHDARRPMKNGAGTFERIAAGIDNLVLKEGMPVNLRFVADRENLAGLPELARFAIDRGWTARDNFKTQIGRNYELHTCQGNREKLYSRLSLYEALYAMVREHPHVLEFHKPAFSVARFLSENGKLPEPLFDACPGCKLEWAFDFRGDIYPCTATVGKPGERVGTFYPEQTLNLKRVGEWQDRDILSIEKCAECSLSMACGGGCASVASNAAGTVNAPDCRPVRELIGMGLDLYKA